MAEQLTDKEKYEIDMIYINASSEAWKTVLKQKYQQYHRLRLDIGEGLSENEAKLMKKLNDLKETHSRRENNRYYWFITIRPSQDLDHQVYLQRLNKFLDSKKIDQYAYVCEVTDAIKEKKGKFLVTTGYTGFHTHLIIKNNKYEKNKIIRDIKNALNRSGKNHLDIIKHDAMIDVDGRRFDHLDNTLKYMEGRKKDIHTKAEAIANTIAWRKTFPFNSTRTCVFKLDLLEDTRV